MSRLLFDPVCIFRAFQMVLAGSLLTAVVGCANLGNLPAFSLGNNDAEPVAGPNGVCTLEVHNGRRRESTSVPLTADSRVQDVLEAGDATGRFRKMKVYVERQSPRHPEEKVRLSTRFDSKTNRISLETDYAVLPGDRIVVVEDNSTKLDQTLGTLLPF